MSVSDVWIKALLRLQPTIKNAHFVTWFQNTALMYIENQTACVGVPSTFAQKWIEEKYQTKVLQALQEIDPTVEKITYEVHSSLQDGTDARAVNLDVVMPNDDKKLRKVNNKDQVSLGHGVISKYLNNKYTLGNFIVGKDNRLPHAACQAVSHNPGGIYNPLFIYGKVGLGKTHLLQAIGNEILKRYPDKKVCYMTSEQFVNDIIEAIGKRHTKSFKDKYRNVDCLIVDDVQFFQFKDSTQQEFFHTFNELYDRNKQIVLSSDRPPSELDGLEDRLTSRFAMGMVVEVLPPDYETRLAILQDQSQLMGVLIDREVLEFIAYNVSSSVRELTGALKQAIAAADLENSVPTVRSVATLLRRLNVSRELVGDVSGGDTNVVRIIKSVDDVIDLVAEYYRLNRSDLLGDVRKKEIMIPRQVCMYLIRQELNESYERIGSDFGGRNHSTVLHACNKIVTRLKFDKRLVRDLNAIKKEMGL